MKVTSRMRYGGLIGLMSLLLLGGCAQNLLMQGRQLSVEGEHQQAVELLQQYTLQHPEDKAAWRELGAAYYRQGDLERAEAVLYKADSTDPAVHLYEGLVFEARGQYSPAITAYTQALSLGPPRKTAQLVKVHLDQLIRKNINQQVSQAIGNEKKIDVDSIPPNTIAVTDFDGSHLNEETAPIARGLAELTAADLAKVTSLKLVERLKIETLMKELKLGADSAVSPESAPRLGRLLGSRRIVTGSVLGLGDDRIRLDGAIVSVVDSTATVPEPTEGKLNKFFDIEKELVFKVIDDLGVSLTTAERDAIQKVPTESYLAFLAYCRGLHFRAKGQLTDAKAAFEQALKYDGGFEQAKDQLESAELAEADVVTASDLENAITEYTGQNGPWPGRDWRLTWLLQRGDLKRKDPKQPPDAVETGGIHIVGDLDAP